jgi:rubrerythrin
MTTESNRPTRPPEVEKAIEETALKVALRYALTLEARVAELEGEVRRWKEFEETADSEAVLWKNVATRLREEREEAFEAARHLVHSVAATPRGFKQKYPTFQDWLKTREGGK